MVSVDRGTYMKKNVTINNSARINKYKNLFVVLFVLITTVAIILTSAITLTKTDYVLKSQVTSVASSLNNQMKANLLSYLSKVEVIGTLVFSDENIYTYDASDPSNDEYESIKIEDDIESALYDISMLENMVDFGVIYSNNHFVGKISNGTLLSFGENLYNDFSKMITRSSTNDGWHAGYKDSYKRIYYVKRINENAVLAVSFYTSELDDVFVRSSSTENIKACITDSTNTIIYSHDFNEAGTKIDSAISERLVLSESGTYIDNEYLIATNDCVDNWKIIQYAPVDVILKEKNEAQYSILLIGIVFALFAALITIFLLEKIITPVTNIVNTLDDEAHTDLLTGVLNKRSFEKYTQETLGKCSTDEKRALILLDIDNFKGVNDNLGHAYGDKVLAGVGDILKRVFNNGDYLGRLGGDEFCVFLNTFDPVTEKYNSYGHFIEEKCSELCRAFNENYTGDDRRYKISASIGVAVFSEHGKSFGELYQCADKALYESKHKGKDTFTIYSSNSETEEKK